MKSDKNQVARDKPLFWERAGNRAVRYGPWKLVSLYRNNNAVELYNIDEDRAENNNVAKLHPEVVQQLEAYYAEWAKETGVVDYNRIKPQRSLR